MAHRERGGLPPNLPDRFNQIEFEHSEKISVEMSRSQVDAVLLALDATIAERRAELTTLEIATDQDHIDYDALASYIRIIESARASLAKL